MKIRLSLHSTLYTPFSTQVYFELKDSGNFTKNLLTLDFTDDTISIIYEGNEEFQIGESRSAHFNIVAQHIPEPNSALGVLALGALGAGSVLKRKLTKSGLTQVSQ